MNQVIIAASVKTMLCDSGRNAYENSQTIFIFWAYKSVLDHCAPYHILNPQDLIHKEVFDQVM